MTLRIMTVDDHPLVRMGVKALVNVESDMELVAEAVDATSALQTFWDVDPDITLVDIQMPGMNGLDLVRRMTQLRPGAKVVVLTTYRGDANARQAFAAGASGYLLKNTLGNELASALREVASGKRCVSPEVADDLAQHIGTDTLTSRELDILKSAASGNENKEIAADLGISIETVKSHIRSILDKLDARNRTDAIRIAVGRGLIPP